MLSAAPRPHYPSLFWTLVRTDLKTRYHGSFGGYLWTLLKPLTMFGVLLTVFWFVFRTPDYGLKLMVGLFLWDFFAESTRAGVGSLHGKGFLLTKARFPPWIVVLTSASPAVVNLVLFGTALCAYLVAVGRVGAWQVALFATYLVLFGLLVFGLSLATSVLYLRFRDLNQIWDLTLQVGFFVAPVVYPLGIIPERFHLFLYAWLPTPVIQFSRQLLLSGEAPSLRAQFLLVLVVGAVLAGGGFLFRTLLPRAVEEL